MKNYDVIIIGGGPAGMMAAGIAGAKGLKILLLEKNDELGKKLAMTGGGRCNITNAEFEVRDFLENFPQAKQFLYSPFSKFDIQATFDFFEERGLPLVIQERKRAFPETESAEDVRRVMVDFVKESGNVEVKLGESVSDLYLVDEEVKGVITNKGEYKADFVVIATGGSAMPETGSTGDGFDLAEKIGHKVKRPNPNLSPLRTKEKWMHKLSGLTLEDMTLRYWQKGKSQFKDRGRLLFTHFGISGPLVINSAYTANELLEQGEILGTIDLFPDLEIPELDQKLIKLFEENSQKKLVNIASSIVQKKLFLSLIEEFLPELVDKNCGEILREERRNLVKLLKGIEFEVLGMMGMDWSIIADGGVDPKEIDFRNMSSRLKPNLYFIGDVLNINRPSGGFSLQLCWTMGFVVGVNLVKYKYNL